MLDVDPAHGGKQSLAGLRESDQAPPRTLYANSGGGGWHLYYDRGGHEVHNTTNRVGTEELSGLDLRGEGGYIVAPPSGHRSGGRYSWVPGTDAIVAIPAWMAERRVVEPTVAPRLLERRERLATYARSALDGECRRVASAAEGARNDALNRAAFALGTLVGAGVLAQDLVVESLARAAAVASRSGDQPLGERDAMRSIRSGLSAGMACPRALEAKGAVLTSSSPVTSNPQPRPTARLSPKL